MKKIGYALIADTPNEPETEHGTTINDPVNHPAHYTDGGIETIDFIEAKQLPYHLGNAVKYISRAGKKDPQKTIQDLEKADWYILRYIELLKKSAKDSTKDSTTA